MRPIKLFRPHPAVSHAAREELPRLARLYEAVRGECSGLVAEETLNDYVPLESDLRIWLLGGFEMFKAELRGELAGALRCTFPTGACLLDALAVSPGLRGQGVGRALLERGVTRARRAGMSKVWLRVMPELATRTSLYHGVGFRDSARTPGTDARLLLELVL